MRTLSGKIKEIQQYHDEQQVALNDSIKDFTAIQRVQNALKITQIEGILEGLTIALKIMKGEMK